MCLSMNELVCCERQRSESDVCVCDSQLHSKLSSDQFHHLLLLCTTLMVNLMLSFDLAMFGKAISLKNSSL